MTHLSEETILSVRDGVPVAPGTQDHLRECVVCSDTLEDARHRAVAIERALAVLATPVAAADEALPGPRRLQFRPPVWTLAKAAGLLLVVGGVASALPGPFQGWIPRLVSGGDGTGVAVQPPAPAVGEAGQVGGRMEVTSGPVVVRLDRVPPGTRIDVRRVAGQSVAVHAGTGSEFAYGAQEVRATIAGGPVIVELPDGIAPSTLIVNGRTYLVVRDDGVEVPGPQSGIDEGGVATFHVPTTFHVPN